MSNTTIKLYRGDDEECTIRLFEKQKDKTRKPLDLSHNDVSVICDSFHHNPNRSPFERLFFKVTPTF